MAWDSGCFVGNLWVRLFWRVCYNIVCSCRGGLGSGLEGSCMVCASGRFGGAVWVILLGFKGLGLDDFVGTFGVSAFRRVDII